MNLTIIQGHSQDKTVGMARQRFAYTTGRLLWEVHLYGNDGIKKEYLRNKREVYNSFRSNGANKIRQYRTGGRR